jgi:hypothetical protein
MTESFAVEGTVVEGLVKAGLAGKTGLAGKGDRDGKDCPSAADVLAPSSSWTKSPCYTSSWRPISHRVTQ